MEITKKSKMFYKLILLVVFLSATFFIADFVFADDDNLEYPICKLYYSGCSNCSSCDTQISSCRSIVGDNNWTINGYSGGAGNSSCCGDDSNEILITPQSEANIYWSPGTTPYCISSYANGCVKNNSFYFEGVHTNLNPDSNDNIAYCYINRWLDCDGRGNCGFDIKGGESESFGEYDSGEATEFCGDDKGEYVINDFCDHNYTAKTCCNNVSKKIDSLGKCVDICPAPDPKGILSISYCVNLSDPNSPPAVANLVYYHCSFAADNCIYKVYKSTNDDFNSASVVTTVNLVKDGDAYIGDDGQHGMVFIIDSDVLANTQYYYWIAEYDNDGNYITKSLSSSAYSGREEYVTGLHSYVVSSSDCSTNAVLWQWDNYPGAINYTTEGSTEIDYYRYDYYDSGVKIPPHTSETINLINNLGLGGVVDYSRPIYFFDMIYDVCNTDWLEGVNLIVRPLFNTQGTVGCQPAAEDIPDIPTNDPPGTPQNLHHTSNTENSITWEWEPGDGGSVDHYIVYNSSGALLDSTVADATYTWNDLEFPNTQYGIKVVAVNSYGVSDATAISYAYTSIEQPTSLSCTPTKTSLAVTANGTISDPSPTNQYLTKIAFAKDGTYSTWQESASINYSGLTCGTSYNIWAKTRNGDGEERDRVSTTCSTQSCTSGPDLIIDNISFSNSVCRGTTVSASITTKNIGDTTTGQTSKTKVYIDSNDVGSGGSAQLLDTWVNVLTANSSQVITTDSWDTTGVSLGEHTMVAIADAPTDSRISESNENNNVLRRSFTVVDCGGGSGSSSFYLLTPTNNATGISISPTLDWEESIGASSYYIYMCEGVDCTLSLLDSTSNDEYVINTPFNYNTIYKWDVVAWNGTETTDSYNGPFSFTTMAEGVIGTPPTAHYDWCKINDNTIQFLDRSVPGDSPINAWEYDFNDGDKCNPDCTESGYDGTNRNPVHTFTDVDPIYSSPDFGWYSTLENNDSILNQEAGSGATVIGTPTYESAVNGSGMIIDQNNEGVKIPINSTNFDYISGAIQLAYKPDYASNSGEPNHYIFRADGPTGDSFELKYQNNGLYYKIYDADADTQCVISAINIIPGWSADQWLKLVATWNQSTSPKMSLKVYDQNSGNLLNSWTNTTCTMNFSTAITLTDMYVGTWVGGTYNALGTVDDFMMFLNDTYTATLSGGLDVSLKATAENGGANTYTETLDLTNGPPCGYNLSSVAAINCHTIDLIWQPHSMTVDGYDIYRSTSASGPWVLVKDGATGTTYSNYDADNINENTRYYYYISTSPMSINNSTDSPACTGGVGAGTKCPLSAVTPICPIDDFRISTIRKCGSITFRFATIENAKSYEIQKSVADNLHYTNVLTIAEDQIATYCNDNYCSYTDTEVLPVNIINPASKFKYWYQARAQGQDDTWTNWSTEISDYSYCYRSKDWQEK